MIELGRKVKDKITGFSGVVTGYVTYISGCNQALVCPQVGNDGVMRDACWLDEQRLVYVDDYLIVLDNSQSPGCDLPAPKR